MLFGSKNKKAVKRWEKEHRDLLLIAKKIIAEYVKGNRSEAKVLLKKFSSVAMDHLISEDLEFYEIMHDPKRKDKQLEEQITKFQKTFSDTKNILMDFLSKYNQPNVELDQDFFESFKGIADVLEKRIQFEESELYFRMKLS